MRILSFHRIDDHLREIDTGLIRVSKGAQICRQVLWFGEAIRLSAISYEPKYQGRRAYTISTTKVEYGASAGGGRKVFLKKGLNLFEASKPLIRVEGCLCINLAATELGAITLVPVIGMRQLN